MIKLNTYNDNAAAASIKQAVKKYRACIPLWFRINNKCIRMM